MKSPKLLKLVQDLVELVRTLKDLNSSCKGVVEIFGDWQLMKQLYSRENQRPPRKAQGNVSEPVEGVQPRFVDSITVGRKTKISRIGMKERTGVGRLA